MKIRFIGDVHGNVATWRRRAEGSDRSVQVGDMGIGFVSIPVIGASHRWIRGNHDDPAAAKEHPSIIQDGTIEGDVMYVGGAWSIDWPWRTPGLNWWRDEQASQEELDDYCAKYVVSRPRIMVTHDCPESAAAHQLPPGAKLYPNRTANALELMFRHRAPELWIFGHWHVTRDVELGGCRFICVGEGDYVDVDLETLEVSFSKGPS